jgi:hypothetical protein
MIQPLGIIRPSSIPPKALTLLYFLKSSKIPPNINSKKDIKKENQKDGEKARRKEKEKGEMTREEGRAGQS